MLAIDALPDRGMPPVEAGDLHLAHVTRGGGLDDIGLEHPVVHRTRFADQGVNRFAVKHQVFSVRIEKNQSVEKV